MNNELQNVEMIPDIENGYLIFGEEGRNKWQTNIRSALIIVNSGKKNTYYLSKECRAETCQKKKIFTIGKYEFSLVVSQNGDNFAIRSYPLIPKLPNSLKNNMFAKSLIPSNLFVNSRKIEKLSYREVLNLLNGNLSKNDIYLKLSYEYKDDLSTIICPANYINYKESKECSYLQVIQGEIIIKDENIFKHAYLAVQIREEETHAELMIKEIGRMKRRNSFEQQKSKLSIFKNLYWLIFEFLFRFTPFYEVNYNKRVILGNIPVEFFKYSK